jgi:hypothetical protein
VPSPDALSINAGPAEAKRLRSATGTPSGRDRISAAGAAVLVRDPPRFYSALYAVLYKEQPRYDEAEKYLPEAFEVRRLKLGDTHPHTLESWHNLIALYEAWGKPEKANEWRAKLP